MKECSVVIPSRIYATAKKVGVLLDFTQLSFCNEFINFQLWLETSFYSVVQSILNRSGVNHKYVTDRRLRQTDRHSVSKCRGLDCSLLGAIGLHYAHLRLGLGLGSGLGLGLGLGLVLGLGVGLALVFSET